MRKLLASCVLACALAFTIPASADGPSDLPGGFTPAPTPPAGGTNSSTAAADDESLMEWLEDFIASLF